jgi:predicted nucleic acid-binding protein
VRFWDTSAVVSLLMEQPVSERARELAREDPEIVAWWGTPSECRSAAASLRREGVLTLEDEDVVHALLGAMGMAWLEVLPGEEVRAQAGRLLRVHPIRASEALQIAAACVWAGSPPLGDFVTFDTRLSDVARLEGFNVVS